MRSRGVLPLLVVGWLLVPLAGLGVWVQRVVLDTGEFTALSDDLLEREAVRDALAAEIVARFEAVQPGVSQAGVPLEPLISDALGAPAFTDRFADALARLHSQLVDGDDRLSLDLDPTIALVADEVRARFPEAAGRIPPIGESGDLVLVRRAQAPYIWAGVVAARWGSLISIVVVLVLLGFAVALARRPGLTLGVAGVGVIAASLLLLALVAAAQAYASRWVSAGVQRAAFEATWDVFQRSLTVQMLLVALVGVAAAAAGFLIELGSTGGARSGSGFSR